MPTEPQIRRELEAALAWQVELGADEAILDTPSNRLAGREAAPAAPPAAPELIAVIRLPEQLDAAWNAGARTIYCEFENPKRYRDAVTRFRELQAATPAPDRPAPSTIWVAPPRIFKPGEEWILQQVKSSNPDGYLVRNYDHLAFFAADRKRGDCSLDIANPLTAEYFISNYGLERVTASYDLNIVQLESLLRGAPRPPWPRAAAARPCLRTG